MSPARSPGSAADPSGRTWAITTPISGVNARLEAQQGGAAARGRLKERFIDLSRERHA